MITARTSASLALAGLIAGAAHAQSTPAAYVERSQVLPTGNVIHAYRVPTTDTLGKIRYFDVTVEIFVNDQGKIASSANVVSVASPKVVGNKFVAGTYKSPQSNICPVSVSILSGSRQQGSINCPVPFSATWATGPIAGHPFEVDLRAAGVDQIAGMENYGWGKIGISSPGTWFGCMNNGEIVSAVQTDSGLTLNGYDQGNVQKCTVTLTLQP